MTAQSVAGLDDDDARELPRAASAPVAAAGPAWVAWAAYAVCSLVWGSTYLAIAVALGSFTTFGMVSIRFGLAAALALLVGRLRGEPLPSRRELPHLALVGLLLLLLANGLIVWSETRVASGLVAVLCATTPAWFALMTLRSEPLGARGWTGTILGFAGVVLLAAPGTKGALDAAGVAAVLLATVAWAYGTLHGKRHVAGGGPLTRAGVEMAAASLAALLLAPATGGFLKGTPAPREVAALLYLSLFGSVIAYTAHGYLARAWSPARAGTYAYLNPGVAVLLGALLLGEPFTPRVGVGMAVILAGVALVQLRRRA